MGVKFLTEPEVAEQPVRKGRVTFVDEEQEKFTPPPQPEQKVYLEDKNTTVAFPIETSIRDVEFAVRDGIYFEKSAADKEYVLTTQTFLQAETPERKGRKPTTEEEEVARFANVKREAERAAFNMITGEPPEISRISAFLGGFIPPDKQTQEDLKRLYPGASLIGKIGQLSILSLMTGGIAPAVTTYLETTPVTLYPKLIPFIANALQRSATWGMGGIVDVIAKEPSAETITHPLSESAFGLLTGGVHGLATTKARVLAGSLARGGWSAGKSLLKDGSLDKQDLTNIGLSAALGAAFELINAPVVSQRYQQARLTLLNRIKDKLATGKAFGDKEVAVLQSMVGVYENTMKQPAIVLMTNKVPINLNTMSKEIQTKYVDTMIKSLNAGDTMSKSIEKAAEFLVASLPAGTNIVFSDEVVEQGKEIIPEEERQAPESTVKPEVKPEEKAPEKVVVKPAVKPKVVKPEEEVIPEEKIPGFPDISMEEFQDFLTDSEILPEDRDSFVADIRRGDKEAIESSDFQDFLRLTRKEKPIEVVPVEEDIQTLEDGTEVINLDAPLRNFTRALEQARKIRKAKSLTKQEIKKVQKQFGDIISKSKLEKADKAQFLTTLRNVQTNRQLKKILPQLQQRITRLEQASQKRKIKSNISRELKTAKPVKKGARRVSKFDIATNRILEEMRSFNKLTQKEAQDKLDALGEPASELDRIKTRFLSLKANGANASLEIFNRVLEDIKQLKEIGKEIKSEQDLIFRLDRKERATELLNAIIKNKNTKDQLKTKIGNIYRAGFSNTFSMLNSLFSRDIATKLDPELAENRRNTAIFNHTIQTALRGARELGVEGVAKFQDRLTQMAKIEFEIVDFEGVRTELNRLQVIDIYNSIKNDKVQKRYYDTFGEDQITSLVSELSDNETDFGDYMQEVLGGFFEVFNKNHIRKTGRDLGQVENYWPATSEREIDIFDDIRLQGETPSAERERAKGKVIPRPVNSWLKLQRQIFQAEHVRHLSRRFEDLKNLIADRKVSSEIKRRFGDDILNVLNAQIDNISLNKQTERLDAVSGVVGSMLNNWVLAKIGLNPSIFIKQLLSTSNYIEGMPVAEWTKFFFEGIASPKQTLKFMFDSAPFLEARFRRGFTEAINRAIDEARKTSRAKDNWAKALSSLVRMGDIGAIVYGGFPVIKHQMSQGKTLQQAVDTFEAQTLKSQQASTSSGLSQFQNSRNPFARMFLAFKNTANQYLRKQADALISFGKGDIPAKQMAKTLLIYTLIQPALYAFAGNRIRRFIFRKEEEENIFIDIMLQLAVNPFMAVPLLNDIANFVGRKVTGKKAFKVFSDPLLGDIETAIRQVTKKDVELRDVLNSFGIFVELKTGTPVKTFTRLFGLDKKKKKKAPRIGD